MAKSRPLWLRFALQFHNVLIYVLIVSGLISLALGHRVDSAVIFAVILVNALVGTIQEGKAEAALRAILSMVTTPCTVLRDGSLERLDSCQLVPGDIVHVQAGDRIPADLRLTYCKTLRCDESALTGESQPVEKQLEAIAADTPLAERNNMAYMGTLASYGAARGVVCHTGMDTEIGLISGLVQQVRLPSTPLQQQLRRFARQLSLAILVAAAVVVLYGYLLAGYPLAEMFQAAISIAVAAIPEGLPAIVTISLAIGVQKMAGKRALVRRLPSVEVLGSVDVICCDKTGTLTTNTMTARRLVGADSSFDISGEGYQPLGAIMRQPGGEVAEPERDPLLTRACLLALLCNDASVRRAGADWQAQGDPTEIAMLVMAMKHGLEPASSADQWPRRDELPFETERRYMATLHRRGDAQQLIAIKGAPDALLPHCGNQLSTEGELQALDRSYWEGELNAMAAEGMRVIALAEKLPQQHCAELDHGMLDAGLTLVALVGISDPPRADALDSIALCHRAGIRVKMITGDNPVTARAIGRELGLDVERVMTGAELDRLTDAELPGAVAAVDVFARTSPANKLQLVNALQHTGHVVAMTGDGVNDAPALRQADIGVAMGGKGTDAAKEASDIVLTDDNFTSISLAVEEGRTVYDNIVKSVLFILPTSFAEASVIIIAIFSGQVLPVTPAQILWINLVTTITLALALGFESAEAQIMQRPPRPRSQGMITRPLMTRIALVGLCAAIIVFWQFSDYRARGASLELCRTVAVNTLVMIEAVYLLNCRFLTQPMVSGALLRNWLPSGLAIAGVMLLQLGFSYAPATQQMFGLASLAWTDWLRALLAALPIVLVVELEKGVWRLFSRRA